jgi:CO/xanthine dehydrogenase FAD-binding subunit
VKPAWFDYYAPRTVEEALHILGDAGQDGRVLAGGQSLIPMLNCRIISPAVIVDINRIEALNRLHVGADGLTVGALVRHADLLRNAHVREGWPLLAEATTQVAHPAIRNRGTVCGSVSHNDPAAEHPSVLVTLGGTVVIAGGADAASCPPKSSSPACCRRRWSRARWWWAALPRPPAGTGAAFVEFARRLRDFAIAGAAAMLTMRDGVCEQARLTIVGMGDGPFRARAAEAALTARRILSRDTRRLSPRQPKSRRAVEAGRRRPRVVILPAASGGRADGTGFGNGVGAREGESELARSSVSAHRERPRPDEKTVPVRLSLADFIREHLHLTGTHLGCEHGVCGACTISMNGRSALVPHARGAGGWHRHRHH